MRFFSIARHLKLLPVLFAVMLLSACAATGTKEENVAARATARWDAVLKGDFKTAYGYLTPGFRSGVSLEQYIRSIVNAPVRWTSAKFDSSKCEESRCDVKMLVAITVKHAVPGVESFDASDYIDETWILVDGKWYMVPDE